MSKINYLTEEEERKIIEYYLVPNTAASTAKKFNISGYHVHKILTKYAVESHSKEILAILAQNKSKEYWETLDDNIRYSQSFDENTEYDIIQKYLDGLSIKSISRIYHCGSNRITQILVKNNIDIRTTAEQKILGHLKFKDSCLKHFGCAYPMQSDLVKAKSKATNMQKYGVDNYNKTDECKEKKKATFIQKYGVDHPCKFTIVKEKIKQTNLEKYGVENVFAAEEIKEKIKKTKFNVYGDEHFTNLEKAKETNMKLYGYSYAAKNEEIRKKISFKYKQLSEDEKQIAYEQHKQTCLEKYGVDWYSKTTEFNLKIRKKYYYNNIGFDSLPELAVYLYCINNNINIKRSDLKFEYIINNEIHYYFPDFEIDGKLVEIKGDHFFKEDGTMCNPFDHSLDELFEAKHQCMLKNNIEIWKSKDYQFALDYFKNNNYNLEDFILKKGNN